MKLIYIASPFSGDVEKNIANARTYCRFAMEQDVNIYCPHLLLPQFMDDSNPQERNLAMSMAGEVMELCDELWCFGDTPSAGMVEEMEQAEALGIPIRRFSGMQELITMEETESCTFTPQI